MTPTRPISTRPKAAGSGCATVVLGIFGALFLLAGLATGWFGSGAPIAHVLAARAWPTARCQILSNEVVHSGGTSRIAVRYRYTAGGREQHAARYDFSSGSDSFSAQKKADFVTQNPAGKEVDCFVNPADPTDAVLDRTMKWGYGFALIFATVFGLPGVFLVGAAVVFIRRTAAAKRAGPGGSMGAALAGAGVSSSALPSHQFTTTAFTPDAGHFSAASTASAGTFSELTAADMGPLVLTPEASPLMKLLVMLFFCLFWNGIVGLFTWFTWGPQSQGGIGVRLFLLPFQAVGLFIFWGVVYQVMALFNPRPTLTLGRGRVRIGDSVPLQWRIRGGASRIGTLNIVLTGREEATYTQGTDTRTDTNEFHRTVILEASDPGRIEGGMTTMNVPAASMHSFKADHNKIVWTLTVSGNIRWWPDVDESFDITVSPAGTP
jgi:hypothetical protein